MNTNAFEDAHVNDSFTQENQEKENTISQNSFSRSALHLTNEQKIIWGGGIVLGIGIILIIISNFGGNDIKASLSNQFTQNSSAEIIRTTPQKTEVVYKDQFGNILTKEQVKNILHPQNMQGMSNISTSQIIPSTKENKIQKENIVKYPEISGDEVKVDMSKKKLYVKKEDAPKLLQQKRLVKKIVDNRPLYVEPITGAVVELIQPIVRPAIERNSFIPSDPSIVPAPEYLKGNISSQEVPRNSVSSGEIKRSDAIERITNPSSAEIGR